VRPRTARRRVDSLPPRRAHRASCRVRLPAITFLLTLPLFLSCASPPASSWWRHVRWLADDARQGRETGSPGYFAAAQYVAHEFEMAGAKPTGPSGYFQSVAFVARRVREKECSVVLKRADGRADTLVLGDDAVLSASLDAADSIDAPAVFAGYGLELPEAGLHDLEGLDLHGAVAIVLRGAPRGVPPTVAAHAQATGERWARLRERGAIGFIVIPNPASQSIPWERSRLSRFEEGFTLADSALDEKGGMRFSLYMNPARAERLFEGSGRTFAEILARDRANQPIPRFALPCRIRARVRMTRRRVESPNVIGVIPGSDPALRGESVVLSAHLDHLGIGAPVAGDSIYNGAMDNASGVAALIEIAQALRRAPRPPRRSIVLLAVTGEEKGLLGSRAFAARPPPAAIGRMVANLNLDMFLPIGPLRSVIAHGIDESDLGDWFRAVADSSGVKIEPDPKPAQTYFVRSDQYNLVRAGVPALFVEIGSGGDSALDRRLQLWMRNRYHAPSDDVRQPIDFAAADGFNRLLLRFCRDVADRPERARWKRDSFFRRYERAP
jgi:hypothetical protein